MSGARARDHPKFNWQQDHEKEAVLETSKNMSKGCALVLRKYSVLTVWFLEYTSWNSIIRRPSSNSGCEKPGNN
jgi:hypothetical protein